MGEISFHVDVRAIRDYLQTETKDYVQRIWADRKTACIEAIGEVLNDNGYLPKDTTWEAWGDECWFSVIKSNGHELAHYFHEGMIYGPNIPIFSQYVYQNGYRWGVGEPIKYRSPKNQPKYPNGEYLKQEPGSVNGVNRWTEAFSWNRALYYDYIERCEEILRK